MLIKTICRRIVKVEVVDSLSGLQILEKKDDILESSDKLLPTEKIDIGVAANSSLLKLHEHVNASNRQLFRFDCRKVCRRFIEALSEKNPLHYLVVTSSRCLDPKMILDHPNDAEELFAKLVTYLYDKKRLSPNEAEKAKEQCCDFISVSVLENRLAFQKFERFVDRLDEFYSALEPKDELFLVLSRWSKWF